MASLDALKNSKHETVKRWVLQALKQQTSGRSSQHTLVSKICSLRGVTSLRGTPRDDFRAKVRKAVGALLREKPASIERVGSDDDHIKLVVKKSKRTITKPPAV